MKKPYFGFAALYQAYLACRRGKRGTRKAQRYEMRLLDNLVNTAQALQDNAWHPSRASRFVTLYPKPREILAAEFSDRVVHHVLVPWLERYFEPVFIHDSFANRRGKGTHAAVHRLQAFTRGAIQTDVDFSPRPGGERVRERGGCFALLREAGSCAASPLSPALSPPGRGGKTQLPRANGVRGWYLQLDIANFFHSIDRRRLFGFLCARIERDMRRPASDARHAPADAAQDMLHLARVLLTGNPGQDARYVGQPQHLVRVPAHKQLVNAAPEKGLPIGNLSSQFFANVYLNALDQFIKHTLKAPHYVRYVDDFVLLHQDPAVLQGWRSAITDFLHEHLGLSLRDAGRLAPIANGIDFLGYIVRPDYLLVRQRVVGHMHDRLNVHARRLLRRNGTLVSPPAASDRLQATVASYWGHFQHAHSRHLRAQTFARHPWLWHILAPDAEGGLQRVDRPGLVTSLASQWTYFRARYPQHVLLVQVGNRWECQGTCADAIFVALHALPAWRSGLPRTWAVPAAKVPALKRLLTRQNQPWCEVCENGYLRGGKKRRQLVALWPVWLGVRARRQLDLPLELGAALEHSHGL